MYKTYLRPIAANPPLLAMVVLATLLLSGCNAAKVTNSPSLTTPTATSLSVSNSSLNFGSVQVGQSKSLSLLLSNTAAQALTVQISQVTTSGAGFNAGAMTLPLMLAAGQSATVTVTFKPSGGGTASGSLSIASNASNPAITVGLSGVGVAPGQLSVSPSALHFGNVNTGAAQSQSASLTAGSTSVTVSTASWTGAGFSVSGISFPLTIAAGKSVPFTITFAPQAAGAVTGGISFLSSATNSPSAETWDGTGVQASQHSVGLTWNPDASQVQGYYVYRGTVSGGPYARISSLQSTTAYTDATVASGQTYYYVVTAVGTNSVESAHSNQVMAAIP